MARTQQSHGFTALRVEGGILPPDFLQEILHRKASQQADSDYGLSKSLVLKDELARYWRIGNDIYANYAERKQRQNLPAERVCIDEWMAPLLQNVFGYEDLARGGSVTLGEDKFALTHRACRGAVPLLIVTRNYHLDRAEPRFGYEGLRRTPHALMQEFLNADDACLWGIVSNGSKFRMLRDNLSLTRPAYIEADLELIFEEELYPDFATLWLTAHATRLKPKEEQTLNPSTCIVENWRAQAHQVGERVRENLRDGVTQALRQLGNGFLQHQDNDALRTALSEGDFTSAKFFQQLLRLVYRLLFLLTAEERDLLHDPASSDAQRSLYAEGYSLSRLRERAARRRHYDRYPDLWRGLQIVFRALAEGAPALGLPGLGGLFHQKQCPELDNATLANEHLLEAIRSLCYFHSGRSLTRVNYRDMGTEELGSIYESLLELHPEIDVDTVPWTFCFIGEERDKKIKGSERKLTGSYYTPPSLVRELIKSALEPVLKRAVTERPENPKAAILDLKILDPACGSGHLLLAAARRMAIEIARIESSSSNSADEILRQHALREVVQHCIYGVDRNPLAVELCKAALWIEAVEPGKPLTFLESHIRLGDSLVGILDPETMADVIPGAAYQALSSDDKKVCRKLKEDNKKRYATVQWNLLDQGSWMPISRAGSRDLSREPEETMQDINRKVDAWQVYQKAIEIEAYPANLFIGAYFAKKSRDNVDAIPYAEDLVRINAGWSNRRTVEDETKKLARQYRFFHWYLNFAEIMRNGGFDVVLGNPPWERIKLQEQEFFATRAPDIAGARNKAERNRFIQALTRENAWPAEKSLFADFQAEKRRYEATSLFVRTGGRFPLTGVGDVNTYAVFAETFLKLINPKGRAGLIVPSNIATDNSTKAFFHEIVVKKRLASLYDFENREAIFSGVHRSYKFCLLTLSGTEIPCPSAQFAFFLHQTEQINESERRFSLSSEDFALFNPNTKTCPIFRTRRDMEISRKMYRRAGVLWKEVSGGEPEINPWGISFQRMFDMSNDSGIFRTREELVNTGWKLQGNVFSQGEERYLPLYEAKMFHQYDHRFATFDKVSASDIKKGNALYMASGHKANSQAVAIPRYWVPEKEVLKRLERASSLARAGESAAGHEHPLGHDTSISRAREEREREREREQVHMFQIYELAQLTHRLLSGVLPDQPTRGLE